MKRNLLLDFLTLLVIALCVAVAAGIANHLKRMDTVHTEQRMAP